MMTSRVHGDVVVECGAAVQEDDKADDGSWHEHARVEAEPGEVDTNLLTKVLPVANTVDVRTRSRSRDMYYVDIIIQ